jgi:glycosyltransferase involved in cell wall biosynthesis
LNGRFVVQFAGNMGRTHDLESVISAARHLREDAGIAFLMIGSGSKSGYVRRTAEEGGLSNVRVLGYQPRADLPVMLTACDVAVVPLVRGLAGISVPSRFYNILAAGKPVIVMAEPHAEPALIVREERIGWVVPPGDTTALLAAIDDARRHPDATQEMGRRARGVAESKYSYAQTMIAYHALVKALGATPRSATE